MTSTIQLATDCVWSCADSSIVLVEHSAQSGLDETEFNGRAPAVHSQQRQHPKAEGKDKRRDEQRERSFLDCSQTDTNRADGESINSSDTPVYLHRFCVSVYRSNTEQSRAEHSNTPQCSSDKATRVGSVIITINHKRNTRRYTVDHTNTTNATVTTASPGRQHVCFGPTREDNWR